MTGGDVVEPKDARKLANASGFLFQLSVEHSIRSAFDGLRGSPEACTIIGREYPWRNSIGGEGFVDLILSKGRTVLVLECKRTRGGLWVFPLESSKSGLTSDIRSLCARRDHEGMPISTTENLGGSPQTPSAQFCAVRGSGEDQAPMLERICAMLLRSAEAFAEEALRITIRPNSPWFYFLPVIVTNATLANCVVNPEELGPDGTTNDGEVEEIPFIRFRKPLTAELSQTFDSTHLDDALADRERTVFVVNSEHLVGFLEQLRIWD